MYDYAYSLSPTFWARLNVCSSAAQAGLAVLQRRHPAHVWKIWLGKTFCSVMDLGLLVPSSFWLCQTLYKRYIIAQVGEKNYSDFEKAKKYAVQAWTAWYDTAITGTARDAAGLARNAAEKKYDQIETKNQLIQHTRYFWKGMLCGAVAVAIASLAVPTILNAWQRPPEVNLTAILKKIGVPSDKNAIAVWWNMPPVFEQATHSLMVCKIIVHLALAIFSSHKVPFALSALLQGITLWKFFEQPWMICLSRTFSGVGLPTTQSATVLFDIQIPKFSVREDGSASLTAHFEEHLKQVCDLTATLFQGSSWREWWKSVIVHGGSSYGGRPSRFPRRIQNMRTLGGIFVNLQPHKIEACKAAAVITGMSGFARDTRYLRSIRLFFNF